MKKELTLQEMQIIETDILRYIHEICLEHKITYYLYGGTLLGAIRHKGFIPWDDDTDIVVPRRDYAKLLKILSDKQQYKLLSYEYVDDYYYPFAKLVDPKTRLVEKGVRECKEMGVWVDIFPLDKTANAAVFRKLHLTIVRKLVGLNRYVASQQENILTQLNSPKKKLHYRLSKIFKSHTVIKWIHKIAALYQNRNTGYLVDSTWGKEKNFGCDSTWFGTPEMAEFSGYNFYTPANSDALLKFLFGNYMQLPPEEKRYSEHFYSCWREE